MTTGKSGFHVFYETDRKRDFDQVRQEIRQMAEDLASRHPKLLTTEVRINKRENRVCIDCQRNAYAQTSVCPFSLRANGSAGVATPKEWEELDKISSGDHFKFKNIFRRLEDQGSLAVFLG